jgi:hypothetical protein
MPSDQKLVCVQVDSIQFPFHGTLLNELPHEAKPTDRLAVRMLEASDRALISGAKNGSFQVPNWPLALVGYA